jgi:hypothetical protein
MPLSRLLRQQTSIVQELGLYLSDATHLPHPRDFVLLTDISARAADTQLLCRHLEVEFWQRSRKT